MMNYILYIILKCTFLLNFYIKTFKISIFCNSIKYNWLSKPDALIIWYTTYSTYDTDLLDTE